MIGTQDLPAIFSTKIILQQWDLILGLDEISM